MAYKNDFARILAEMESYDYYTEEKIRRDIEENRKKRCPQTSLFLFSS